MGVRGVRRCGGAARDAGAYLLAETGESPSHGADRPCLRMAGHGRKQEEANYTYEMSGDRDKERNYAHFSQ